MIKTFRLVFLSVLLLSPILLAAQTARLRLGSVLPANSLWDRSLKEMANGWQVIDGHHLEKEYTFKNFDEALAFTHQVGTLAEEIFHHPDIFLAWGKVKITIWTHKIDGLNEADFIFAAKADALLGTS